MRKCLKIHKRSVLPVGPAEYVNAGLLNEIRPFDLHAPGCRRKSKIIIVNFKSQPPSAPADWMWRRPQYYHKDVCTGGIWAYLCHPTPRCRMAQLLCQLLSFVSTHFTLVAAPVFSIPVWRLCRRIKHREGVCHLGSSDWERLSCPSLPQQARQSHTGRPTLRQGQRKQANKTTIDNNL